MLYVQYWVYGTLFVRTHKHERDDTTEGQGYNIIRHTGCELNSKETDNNGAAGVIVRARLANVFTFCVFFFFFFKNRQSMGILRTNVPFKTYSTTITDPYKISRVSYYFC